MFVTIALVTLALVLYLTIRDWIRSPLLSPKIVRKVIKQASELIALGDWARAEKLLFPLLEKGKGGKEVALLEIKVLRKSGVIEKALSKAIEGGRTYPEDLLFRLEEGFLLLELDRPKEALAAFQVCAPILRREEEILAHAAALHKSGRSDEATELLHPRLHSTQNGDWISLLGDIYFHRKEFTEAICAYQRVVELGHPSHYLFIQIAHAYRRLGNLSEAEKIFHSLLDNDPIDLPATLGLGACLQERGHYHKALLIYQSTEAWTSKDPQLLKEAGICALRTEKYAYAERYFFELICSEEPDSFYYAYYGLALEGQQKWQEAEQIYIRLLQLFPSYPHGYRALSWMFGVGLTRTLSNEQGLSYAHVALKLKGDLISYEILSACEARVGNFDRAYTIQTYLAEQDKTTDARSRRRQSMRTLRNHHPLEGHQVVRSLVA